MAGELCLVGVAVPKTWVAGTSPALTHGCRIERETLNVVIPAQAGF